MGIFGGKKLPKPEPLPAPVTKEEASEAGEKTAGEARKRRGRKSTILSGGQEVGAKVKKLLGGG